MGERIHVEDRGELLEEIKAKLRAEAQEAVTQDGELVNFESTEEAGTFLSEVVLDFPNKEKYMEACRHKTPPQFEQGSFLIDIKVASILKKVKLTYSINLKSHITVFETIEDYKKENLS